MQVVLRVMHSVQEIAHHSRVSGIFRKNIDISRICRYLLAKMQYIIGEQIYFSCYKKREKDERV